MKISPALLIVYLMIILLGPFTSCDKSKITTKSPFPPIVMENPLQEYAFTNNVLKNNFVLQIKQPDSPTEIGLKFSASKAGILWSIGFKMPEKGKYFISLWEVASKQLILTDSVSYTDPSKFIYKALLLLNKAVIIDKNKDYMAGIFLAKRPPESPLPYYVLSNPTIQSFAFNQAYIACKATPVLKITAPVYPAINSLDIGFNYFGLVDIGYYATEF